MTEKKNTAKNHLPRGLELIYEDKDLIVVNKPAGLLTMGTERERERTAYHALTDYVKKGVSTSAKRIFIVHRLDKETSGLLIFAKNPDAKNILQANWDEVEKKYLAIVRGKMEKTAETIVSYLAENKAFRIYSTSDIRVGKLSKTFYTVLKETRDFSLLEISLLTGRKHQIRVHLADSGHPVIGDREYGDDSPVFKNLALHAYSLTFKHPVNGKQMTFHTNIPLFFYKLVGNINISGDHQSSEQATEEVQQTDRQRINEKENKQGKLRKNG